MYFFEILGAYIHQFASFLDVSNQKITSLYKIGFKESLGNYKICCDEEIASDKLVDVCWLNRI